MIKTKDVFDNLNPTVAALAKSRFNKPTEIQNLAIPKVLEGKNVLAIAGTGMGKTESLMLPLFSKLISSGHKPISLLYVTPLKALNRDMFTRLLWWCQKLDLDASVRHGDTTQHQRKLQTEHPPHLLITTPEQIQGMLTGKRLREHLKNIKYLVIDEVHELIDSKRGMQLTLAIERLKRYCANPQILALSATIGSPKEAAEFIGCTDIVVSPETKRFEILVDKPKPEKEDHQIADKIFSSVDVAARLRFVKGLLGSHKSILMFTNTREAAEVLSSRLRAMDDTIQQDVHHSSLSKESRLKAESDFKSEKLKSLICTSSLQLGIDIGSVDLVIQYQSPREVSQLTQRVGRSGHGIERLTKGIIIAGDGDDLFESAVIARKAMSGELEPIRFHRKSLDVLTHQIVGLTMEDYSVDLKTIKNTFINSNPFKDMTKKDIEQAAQLLEQSKIVYIQDGIKRKRRAFEYYFENLSTIPDNKSYKVIDLAINQPVGTLDENFIAEHSETGSTFIVRGRPWRVISVDNDKVFVEPSSSIESAVPAWEGELIPVPFDVAQEVAKIRSSISSGNIDFLDRYPITENVKNDMIKLVKEQSNFYVPGQKEIGIEKSGEFVILHACFGSLANEAISRFISTIISAETGRVVPARMDPYRIIFSGVSIEEIKDVIKKYKPEDIKTILEISLPNTSLFKWRFIQVAKRFGIIGKGAKFDKINIKKLLELYRGTPVFEETLNEIFVEKIDVEKASEIFKLIKDNKIKLVEFNGLSPLGELGIKYELHDVAKPDRPMAEILKIFKRRLFSTRLRLVCVSCGKYSVSFALKEIKKEPRCPKCASKLLACVSPFMTESQDIIKKRLKGKDLTMEEQKKLERIKQSADIIIVYGKRGCEALAGRGVGPQTASRILARMHKSDDELYKDILSAEKAFIQTKKYWT